MSRFIFVNRFFYPDHSATSQILSDLAFHLASCGEYVHIVTSRQRYDNPKAALKSDELVRGVHVHRVASTQLGRVALPGRTVDYLSFYWSVLRKVRALARPGDILIAKTDPPLLSIIGRLAARKRDALLVNWLQDLFPEVAIELGVPFTGGLLGRVLAYFRDQSLKAAAANVVLGRSMAERVIDRGVRPGRVHVIPNWSDDEEITPVATTDNPLRREWDLEGKFVVGYSGNLGRAHEFETILTASERLRDQHRIVFLFIGGGYQLDELRRRISERGLDHIYRFVPYQNRERLKYSLSLPDVHWISLKPELEGLILPSKFYGIAAAGRPILAIMAGNGEIAQLVRQHECGVVIQPGQADLLADTLVKLSQDIELVKEMGARARTMLDAHFSRRKALQSWETLLREIVPAANRCR